MASLPQPETAGIWLVQDTAGQLVSSGLLTPFPAQISSTNYAAIIPGAAGLTATEFGMVRTGVFDGHGPYRVAYIVAAPKRE